MRRKIQQGFSLIVALIFIALGFIGLALPVVPQAIFFLIGFTILSFHYPPMADYIESKMDKSSKIYKVYHSYRAKLHKYFG